MTDASLDEGEASRAHVFDVVGVGAACLDIVSRVPVLPAISGPSSKVRVSARVSRCGGQTATALCGCARLGLRAAFVGAVGQDEAGQLIRRTLMAHGVDVSGLSLASADTATALIVVPESSGERMVLWHRDVGLSLVPAHLPTWLDRARVVHVDDVDLPLAIEAARRARGAGCFVTTDIDQTMPEVFGLVEEATHAIFAEHVPVALTGESSPAAALAALGARFPDHILVVTLGASGALAWHAGALTRVEGHDVEAVDTTGAGDLFRAGFIYGLCQGWSLGRMLAFANATAALSCTRHGGIDAAPTREEVEALIC